MAILNGLFPNDIHQFIYLSLGEILDLLSLINCNTCFIVYPMLSSQYRYTLQTIFHYMHNLFKKGARKRDWQKIHGTNNSKIHSNYFKGFKTSLGDSSSCMIKRLRSPKALITTATTTTNNKKNNKYLLSSNYYAVSYATTTPSLSTTPSIGWKASNECVTGASGAGNLIVSSRSLLRISESQASDLLLYFHDNEADDLL